MLINRHCPSETLYERLFACQADLMLAVSEYELTEEECHEWGVREQQAIVGGRMQQMATAIRQQVEIAEVSLQVELLERRNLSVIRRLAALREARFIQSRHRSSVRTFPALAMQLNGE